MSENPTKFEPKKFPRKKIFTIVVAAMALLFIFSFIRDHVSCVGGFPVLKKDKAQVPRSAPQELPVPVKVYKVSRVSFRDTMPSLGTIKGFREFDLKFAEAGSVEYVNFRAGERIIQGDIIASLDQKEALLKLEYAKVELDKQNKLYDLGAVHETKLKQSQLEYQSAKAELDKTNLVAVSDGYIGSLEVDKGSFVTPQDKVGTFVDMKDVYVEFGVIEKDAPKIKEGQNVEVTVESYPDKVFKGRVESVSPLVEGRSRTVEVRAKISNPDERLKPGMFGRANVMVYEKEQALVVPSSSFKKKENEYFVYMVHLDEAKKSPAKKSSFMNQMAGRGAKAPEGMPQEPPSSYGTVEVRPVELEYATPDAIEIREGVEEGDLVIVDVEQDLQDKSKVEILETQEGIF